MSVVFDGRKFAGEVEARLPKVATKLLVVLDPENSAGVKYVEIKKKVGERLGVKMEVAAKPEIEKWNNDPDVNGIMIQMPYPNSASLINLIDPKKDVDGLREDSPFKPAVTRAVEVILEQAKCELDLGTGIKVLVVGNKGKVGRSLEKHLFWDVEGMGKDDFDVEKIKNADAVISCTGQPGLITGDMVKEGFVAIDVGYPKPEFTQEALSKASFFTPVPGGVGPVTVVMLFKNLIESVHELQ